MKQKELYKKYRPKKFDRVIGQDAAVRSLETWLANDTVPHTIMFSGPSGCGKTTMARILKKELNCGKYDFIEVNCADVRGIDYVRKVRQQMKTVPIDGDCRIWLIDEAHKLTNDAQNALLKILEDTPAHVYFMLATTDPQKLLRTIRTRSTEVKVRLLETGELSQLINRVIKKEGKKIKEKVRDKIAERSEGSARSALVLLHQIIDLNSEKDMLEVISRVTSEKAGEFIGRALMNAGTKWRKMAGILREYKDEDAETIRYQVLGYAKAVMLSPAGFNKATNRAFLIIEAFREPFYNTKHAGLVAACYEVIVGAA